MELDNLLDPVKLLKIDDEAERKQVRTKRYVISDSF